MKKIAADRNYRIFKGAQPRGAGSPGMSPGMSGGGQAPQKSPQERQRWKSLQSKVTWHENKIKALEAQIATHKQKIKKYEDELWPQYK